MVDQVEKNPLPLSIIAQLRTNRGRTDRKGRKKTEVNRKAEATRGARRCS